MGLTTAIEADGLGKRYGGVVALESVTFTVPPGEILGVLGPNGAGKKIGRASCRERV